MDPFACTEPFTPVLAWYEDARRNEPRVPEAAQVASVGADGRPSLRTVLVRGWGPDGFVFFTNHESRKGRELLADGRITLLFHWKSLERQVIVEGLAHPTGSDVSDDYWATRPRGSQLSALASPQSRPVPSRQALVEAAAELAATYPDSVPRPAHWGGFRVVPHRIELWQGQPDRLHDRAVFERHGDGWTLTRLAP